MARTEAPPESASGLDRYFHISDRGSTVRTEIVAGAATWLTMAYILFVNPAILGFIGIPGLQDRLMRTIEARLGALPELDEQPVEVPA